MLRANMPKSEVLPEWEVDSSDIVAPRLNAELNRQRRPKSERHTK